MTQGIRTPVLAPQAVRDASPRSDNPAESLVAHYANVSKMRMADPPGFNSALSVEAVGFARSQGDWLGVVITPWFLDLFLLPGGGELWGDIPVGERRYLNLPWGTLQFIADDDPDIGPYQYCPLVAAVSTIADMNVARQLARDTMASVLQPAASAAPAVPVGGMITLKPASAVPRRRFLARLIGRR